MVKCVQLVGRLRDRATALFGGKVRIRIVVATSPPDLWISGYVFVTMGHNVPFSRVAVLASFVSSVVCPRIPGWPALTMVDPCPLMVSVPPVWRVPMPMLCLCRLPAVKLWVRMAGLLVTTALFSLVCGPLPCVWLGQVCDRGSSSWRSPDPWPRGLFCTERCPGFLVAVRLWL